MKLLLAPFYTVMNLFTTEINQFCQQVKDKSKIVISKFENK